VKIEEDTEKKDTFIQIHTITNYFKEKSMISFIKTKECIGENIPAKKKI